MAPTSFPRPTWQEAPRRVHRQAPRDSTLALYTPEPSVAHQALHEAQPRDSTQVARVS